jgi:hypothetical protein
MPAAQIIGQAFYGFAQDFHQSFAQHLLAPVAAKFFSRCGVPQLDRFVANLGDLPQGQICVMHAHKRETTRP